ncbi:MAG TPA: AbrB/MazE/SpoVT family DNA-binding domain-containing protein [Thermoanaerobaculia bacterium]|nr:AbrB/MazE/SpoVT family DNA-binding domain-containing protein [Thermoanaerobaculia bacterium]
MSKITSKLQVTLPKALAERYGLKPGDEIQFEPASDSIRIVIPMRRRRQLSVEERLRLFDAATARIEEAQKDWQPAEPPAKRRFRREELYQRGYSGRH